MTTKQRREFLIDSDYTPMTEFCKPSEDDIYVVEITNEEAVYNKADVEELIGALENAIQYCEPQMVDILHPILKKALERWEGK